MPKLKKKLNRDFTFITNRYSAGLLFNRQIKQEFGQIGHLNHQYQENGGGTTCGNEVNYGPIQKNSKSTIFSRLGLGPIPIPNRGVKSQQADASFNSITKSTSPSPSLFKIEIDRMKGQLNGRCQSSLPQRTNFLKVDEPSLPPLPKIPKFLSFKIQISNPDAQPSPLSSPQASPVKNNTQINKSSSSNEVDNSSESESESENESVSKNLETSQSQIEDNNNVSDQELELEEDNSEESQMEEQEVSLNEEEFVVEEEEIDEEEEEEFEYEIIEEEMEIDEEIEENSSKVQNFSPSPIKSKMAKPAPSPSVPETGSNKPRETKTGNQRPKSKIVEITWNDQPKKMEKNQDHKLPTKTQKQNMKGNASNINSEQDQATVKVKSVIKSSPIKLPSPSPLASKVVKPQIPSLFKDKIKLRPLERDFLERDNLKSSQDLCSKRNDLTRSSTKSSRITSRYQNKITYNHKLTKTSVKPSTQLLRIESKSKSKSSKLTTRRKSKEDIYTRPNKLPPVADRAYDISDKIKNFLLKDRIQMDRSSIKLKKDESDSDNRKLKYKDSRSRNSSLSKVKTDKPSGSGTNGSSRISMPKNNNNHDRSRANTEDKINSPKDLLKYSSSSKYSSHKIERNVEKIRFNEHKSPERDRNRSSNRKSLIDIDKVYDTYRKPETSPVKRNTEIERVSNNNKTTNKNKNIKFSQTREILTSDITKRDRSSIFEKFGIFIEDGDKKYKDEEVSLIRRRRMSDEDDKKPKPNLISFVAAGKSKIDEVKVKSFQDDDIDQMVNLENYGNVALKIALKMGFKPGQGLGKKEQGIRIPIEMDRKPAAKKIRRDGIL